MKKIILVVIAILMLTGCGGNKEYKVKDNNRFSIIYRDGYKEIAVDNETCVEYMSNYGESVTIMCNADGTIKLNEECLNENN